MILAWGESVSAEDRRRIVLESDRVLDAYAGEEPGRDAGRSSLPGPDLPPCRRVPAAGPPNVPGYVREDRR